MWWGDWHDINKMQRMCTEDKDKCDLGEDDCHDNAVCTDTDGSFTCACKFGYSGDGKTCTSSQWFCAVHIDKGGLLKSWALEGARAQLAHGSQANRQAIIPMTGNKAGDPHTLDKSWDGGSMWWGDWHDINKMQRMCTGDKDECDLGEDDCHNNAVCTDTDGSFTCACKSGYSGDGKTCTSSQWFCAVHIDKGVLLKSWTLEGARAQLAHGSQANRQAIIPMTGNKA